MSHVLPAVRGLRTLYVLSSEKLWFALAVLGGLVLAPQMLEALRLLDSVPLHQMGF